MKRRTLLTAGLGWPLATALPRAFASPTAPGEAVQWPQVRLLDGSRWMPAPGHAVVAVFWSATCEYCLRHNAHVEKLHRAATGRPIAVLGVSKDDSAAIARRHIAEHGYTFPNTLDAGLLAAVLSTRRITPLTVTVDRQGRLKQVIPGEMFEDDVMELLKRLTAQG
jgi:peroxiredoxin